MRLLSRRRPLLSVVVPVYDVEGYLAQSMDSILGQSHSTLEVIVVDDGSTDRSGDLADEIAANDPRVTVIHQANSGLGAARNAGSRQATGTYLAYADSDDLVPDRAYEVMVASLERTGSDLAVGSVTRFDDDRTFELGLMNENHREPRASVGIEEVPLMLADVFAWNKVFRRSFWEQAGLAFPEGVRYEDQPTLTRAFIQAERFDVLTEPVYRWRIRGDGTSISQQRAALVDLSDRMLTKRWSTAAVEEDTSAATQDVWYRRVLPIDMWEYFRAAPGCDDAYWAMLRQGLEEFWGPHSVPFEQTTLPLRQRLMGWLVAQDRRDDLSDLLDFIDLHGGLPRRREGDEEVVEHPFLDLPELPSELRGP